MDRFHIINEAVKSSLSPILLLGNSLTEQWDPAAWSQYLGRRGALNGGINGDRTEHLLWRLQHGNLEAQSPKAVVLLIGTNDVGRNRSADIIAEGIRTNVDLLRSRFPTTRILLIGLLPRGQLPSSPRRKQIRDVNHLIRQCADGKYVFYADVGGALLQEGAQLSSEISPDGVHLSPLGYAVLSKRLEPELDRVLSGGGP